MTEQHDPHPADAVVGDRGKPDETAGAGGHGPGDGNGDGHDAGNGHGGDGHDGEALGPIDIAAWGAAIIGIALGLVVLVSLLLALS